MEDECRCRQRLADGVVVFQKGASGFEIEGFAINDEDPVPGLFGDGFDVLDGVALGAELLGDETGVNHAATVQEAAVGVAVLTIKSGVPLRSSRRQRRTYLPGRRPKTATLLGVPTKTWPLTMTGVMNLLPVPKASRWLGAWLLL